jgi:hypothetical protein
MGSLQNELVKTGPPTVAIIKQHVGTRHRFRVNVIEQQATALRQRLFFSLSGICRTSLVLFVLCLFCTARRPKTRAKRPSKGDDFIGFKLQASTTLNSRFWRFGAMTRPPDAPARSGSNAQIEDDNFFALLPLFLSQDTVLW